MIGAEDNPMPSSPEIPVDMQIGQFRVQNKVKEKSPLPRNQGARAGMQTEDQTQIVTYRPFRTAMVNGLSQQSNAVLTHPQHSNRTIGGNRGLDKMARTGVEPATQGFSVLCSTT
jgi:hypothetical protein